MLPRALVLSSAVLLCARAANAQPVELQQTAKRLYEAAQKAYEEGRLQEAVDLLTQTYALTPAPILLYNRARAYQALHKCKEAKDDYERYVHDDPNAAPFKVEEQIAQCVAAPLPGVVVSPVSPTPLSPSPAHPSLVPSPRSPSVVPWFIAGAGVVGLGTGAVLGALALQRHADGKADVQQLETANDNAAAKTFATGANIAFVAGGALAALGTVWGILSLRAGPPSSAASAQLVLGAGWATLANAPFAPSERLVPGPILI
jgi:tetratricopeptide (TPR) repeat protein